MFELSRVLDRLAQRLGGARVLALPLLRTLALLAAMAWLVLAPPYYRHSGAVLAVVIGFFAYSLVVEAALWCRPAATLRHNFYVLLLDQAFALTLIYFTGGARSALYLALPLIAALQSYYYGTKRGVAVAVAFEVDRLSVTVSEGTTFSARWGPVRNDCVSLKGSPAGWLGSLADRFYAGG